eukprot:TRINITY_DN12188_c0_g1_i1.p1 TRINITY_DN12188_c0_g1~~TRINITY_DN12188_c0_g1_i1.p1  ORF type:complete len:441 (-),score=80.91 TRINITY_DN12188_c0_g1_i1:87-1409(-)
MAPRGGGDSASAQFVFGGTPVSDVVTSVDGLRGSALRAAQATAADVQGARNLGDLDARLRAAPLPDIEVQVAPAENDAVHVSFRPPPGWRADASMGLCEAPWRLTNCVALRVDGDVAARTNTARATPSAGALLNLGRDSISAALRLSPFRVAGFSPIFEVGMSCAELTRSRGPRQLGQRAAISAADATGRHTIRLEAASRELVPDPRAAEAVLHLPLQTTTTSVGYSFLSDERPAQGRDGRGELRHASVELAGLLGDVASVRAEGTWAVSQAWREGGGYELKASAGLAAPLDTSDAKQGLPLEDRFFLGGALGGPNERLPGFEERGLGPAASRCSGGGKAFDHVGGAARLGASATARWPVPMYGPLQVLAHLSAGTLANRAHAGVVGDLVREVRASSGVGLGVPLPSGGFAGLSLSLPLLKQPSDRLSPLQVWVSFSSSA